MGMDRLSGAGVLTYIRNAVTSVIRPRSESGASARLRRDRVNEKLYDQVLGKFGNQSKYDRSLIRAEIEKARQSANAARSDARRDAEKQDNGKIVGFGGGGGNSRKVYNVDVIISWQSSDGTMVKGRVMLENVPGGTMADVRGMIEASGVLDDIYGGGLISHRQSRGDMGPQSPPTMDNIKRIDILAKTQV